MKPVKMAIAALALATLSFSVMAATLVDVAPANQQKIGVISACSSSNSLSSLQRELENKAKSSGGKCLSYYRRFRQQPYVRYGRDLPLIVVPREAA
ncbi:Multiple stress resistance protein BhsA precursor [Serratia fonticola]|uniref:Multiple stress resistance protein BhsA n=1 Tax=Serratia fonticola TaxID=47917 RepID=A0A4U9U8Z2_SERFO|nr:Multiple stress resistance protein BhsA precursor [Serratia fonticola]